MTQPVQRAATISAAGAAKAAASALLDSSIAAGIFAASAVAVAVLPAKLHAQQVGRTPVSVTIPVAPSSITAIGRVHVAYELHITNYAVTPLRLDALNAFDADRKPLESLSGARLASRISIPGQVIPRVDAGPTIPIGVTAIVFMWTTLTAGTAAPSAIGHQLVFSANETRRDTLTIAVVAMRGAGTSSQALAPIAAPVRGGPWIAIRGPSNTSGHRLSMVALDGAVRIPQRYAVDWGKIGDDGKLFRADSTKNSAWYSYGDTVYAATAGRVAIARDGIADNTPFAAAPAIVDAEQATGNLIAVEIGRGQFAHYAHLKPGSLRVKVGDNVVEGQPIALVGNSGNSLGPHLHFQLGDAAELLRSEGLPYAMREFQLIGRIPGMGPLLAGAPWVAQPNQPPRDVKGESPLENMVVRFGPTR